MEINYKLSKTIFTAESQLLASYWKHIAYSLNIWQKERCLLDLSRGLLQENALLSLVHVILQLLESGADVSLVFF